MIGGIANLASVGEVHAFARAELRFAAAGASLYDAPITSGAQWDQLGRLACQWDQLGRLACQRPRRVRAGSARFIQEMRASSQRLR